jgi:hypothetical protein
MFQHLAFIPEVISGNYVIRLFHRGVTDKLCHGIVDDLEKSAYAIHQLKWGHK